MSSEGTKKQPAVTLHCWGPDFGLASVSPFCLKVQLYCHLAEIPFSLSTCTAPNASPTRQLPMMEIDDTYVAGSDMIIEKLAERVRDLDEPLTDAQRAESFALTALVEQRLYMAQLIDWWQGENFDKLTRRTFSRQLPFPLGLFIKYGMRERALEPVRAMHWQSPERAYEVAERIYAALAARLGEERPFFFGERPTSFDACAFAHLATQYYYPAPGSRLRAMIARHANLVSFVERVQESYFDGPIKYVELQVRSFRVLPSWGEPTRPRTESEWRATEEELSIERRRFFFVATVVCGFGGYMVIRSLLGAAGNSTSALDDAVVGVVR